VVQPEVSRTRLEIIEALCDGLEQQEQALRQRDYKKLSEIVGRLETVVVACREHFGGLDSAEGDGGLESLDSRASERLRAAAASRLVVSELINLELSQINAMLQPGLDRDEFDLTYGNRGNLNSASNSVPPRVSRRV